MHPWRLLLAASIVLTSFVGLDGNSGALAATRSSARCDSSKGADLDVAHEPDWRSYAIYREWTRVGCLVRIDVLADRSAPSHCGWQSARVILAGHPLGTRYTTPSDTVQYVRDPKNLFHLAAKFASVKRPPNAARDAGYRSGKTHLWIVPADNTVIYLVTGGRTERWPRGDPPLCA